MDKQLGSDHSWGKSTESALSKTVNVIEKFLAEGKYCIGIFLDIQGAFDTIHPNYIRTKLLEHGGHKNLVNWSQLPDPQELTSKHRGF